MSGWVLVVEDNADMRFIVVSNLEDEGFDVVEAENGSEALVCLGGRSPPCVIVLDLMMPVMSGIEFLTRRKMAPAIASVPVLVVTGASDYESDLQDFQVAQVYRKPYAQEALLRKVREFCPGPV